MKTSNFNLPNFLSVARVLLTAIFIIIISLPLSFTTSCSALVIFVVAAITDFFDGYLARKWQKVTNLGKLLDPLADKVLVAAGIMYLVTLPNLLPLWIGFIILSREFMVTGLRLVAVEQRVVIAANSLGKWKTILQIVFLISSLLAIIIATYYQHDTPLQKIQWIKQFSWWLQIVFYVQILTMYLSLILTVWSGWVYFYRARILFK